MLEELEVRVLLNSERILRLPVDTEQIQKLLLTVQNLYSSRCTNFRSIELIRLVN